MAGRIQIPAWRLLFSPIFSQSLEAFTFKFLHIPKRVPLSLCAASNINANDIYDLSLLKNGFVHKFHTKHTCKTYTVYFREMPLFCLCHYFCLAEWAGRLFVILWAHGQKVALVNLLAKLVPGLLVRVLQGLESMASRSHGENKSFVAA